MFKHNHPYLYSALVIAYALAVVGFMYCIETILPVVEMYKGEMPANWLTLPLLSVTTLITTFCAHKIAEQTTDWVWDAFHCS